MKHILLLTGRPGIGKTTLLRRVVEELGERPSAGFLTEEIRGKERRLGFRITPLGSEPRVMAHVDHPGPERVGRYGVDLAAIDGVVEDLLQAAPRAELVLIDEIGKMECLSQRFVNAMRTLFEGRRPIVATIAQSGGGFIAEAKRRRDAELREVELSNREGLVESVLSWIDAPR